MIKEIMCWTIGITLIGVALAAMGVLIEMMHHQYGGVASFITFTAILGLGTGITVTWLNKHW